jgi:hypothetical protein
MTSKEREQVLSLYDRALDLLSAIVEEAHDDPTPPGPIETGLLYRHANNIVWLATDLTLLMNEGRIAGPPILLRAMLESMFHLAAGVSVPNFAARKAVSELMELDRRLRVLEVDQQTTEILSKLIAERVRLQTQYQLDPKEGPWTVSRCIRESTTMEFLRNTYFLLSQHTHAASSALLSRHTGIETGILQSTIIGCIAMSAGFAAQLLPTKTPQAYVDKAAALIGELTEMMTRGVFA